MKGREDSWGLVPFYYGAPLETYVFWLGLKKMSCDKKSAVRPSAIVCTVVVRVSSFWRQNPETWFLVMEGWFVLVDIIANAIKFNHVFVGLKEQLMKRLSVSQTAISQLVIWGKWSNFVEQSECRALKAVVDSATVGWYKGYTSVCRRWLPSRQNLRIYAMEMQWKMAVLRPIWPLWQLRWMLYVCKGGIESVRHLSH